MKAEIKNTLLKLMGSRCFKPFILGLTILFAPFITSSLLAAEAASKKTEDTPWTLWKEADKLSLSFRPYKKTGLIEIKAQARLPSSLSGFLLFLQDYPLIPNWLDNAKEAYLIEQVSDTENLFVTRFKRIWPVSEREMVIRSRYWQNPDLSVELAVQDASHEVDNPLNVIRIKLIKAHWLLSPISSKEIQIQHTIIADPGGSVPLWLANKVSLRSMWNTLNAMDKQLSTSPWQQMPIPWIREREK